MIISRQAVFALLIGAPFALNVHAGKLAEEEIAERIKPVGEVCIQGEDCGDVQAATAVAESGAATAARSGQAIYDTKCFACHGTGAAGAPKMGDAAEWSARLSEKGEELLIANAINGINAMPANGTCADCSEDEIAATVRYILENSQ